jgi:hypothetical protein
MFQNSLGAVRYRLDKWTGKWHRVRYGTISENIFFLHIPKCGGTSVTKALYRKFQPNSVQSLNVDASTEVSNALNMDLMAFREYILLYSLAMYGCRHVAGHFVWSDKAHQIYGKNWRFVTILRHPVEKWFSQYYFNRYKDADHFRIKMDIESFLDSREGKALGFDQINKLSDATITNPDEMLEAALINLDKFDVIGITGHFDRFQQDFNNQFKTPIFIPHLNKNPAQNRKRQASDNQEIREHVEEICKPDMILYRAALDKLGLPHPA